jgi:hypothetical protein
MISTKVVKITPTMAKNWLEKNSHNRPLNKRHLERLAKSISDGEWQMNGESIKISKCGSLLDGQHRLSAIVKTGTSVSMMVTKGLPLDTFHTMNIGARVRGAADVLAISGEKNYATLASAARMLKCWELDRGAPQFKGSNGAISVKQIEDTIARHPNIRNFSSYKAPYLNKFFAGSVACFLGYLFHSVNAKKADIFFEGLVNGAGLESGNAILLLRDRLLFNAADFSKLPREAVIALTIKAWNSHYDGIKLGQLRFGKNEKFPIVSGAK